MKNAKRWRENNLRPAKGVHLNSKILLFELLHHIVVFLLHVAVSAIDRSSLSGLKRNLGLGSALTTYCVKHLSGTLIESTASLERHLLFSPCILFIDRSGFPTLPIRPFWVTTHYKPDPGRVPKRTPKLNWLTYCRGREIVSMQVHLSGN